MTLKLYKPFSALFVFTVLTASVKGQTDFKPGYVISAENDTLYGRIDLQTDEQLCKVCLFRPDDSQSMIGYRPDDIKAYRFTNGRYFVSRSLKKGETEKNVFLELLVDGIYDLYYFSGKQGPAYYIEPNDSSLVLLSSSEIFFINEYGDEKVRSKDSYKGVLKYTFQDQPAMQRKIRNVRFDHKSLIDITVDYHQRVCPDEECLLYFKNAGAHYFIGPRAGFKYASFNLHEASGSLKHTSLEAGIGFRIKPVRVRSRWNVLINLLWSDETFNGNIDSIPVSGAYTRTCSLSVSYSMLRFPVYLEYAMPLGKLQPSFFSGLDNAWFFGTESDMWRGTSRLDPYYTEYRKFQTGLLGGIGIRYLFNEKWILSLSGEYSYRMPPLDFNYNFDMVRMHTVAFRLGLDYRIF